MMGMPHLFEKPVLFIGVLFRNKQIFDGVLPALQNYFGTIFFQSTLKPWTYSSHYDKELGTPIYRSFVFFEKIIDPSSLSEIKLITNDLEAINSIGGNRMINLDPGYLTLAKVVLASTKNYSHRIYLGRGIYAELALVYKNQQFNSMFYTYNDYKDETYLKMFKKVRELLKKKQAGRNEPIK
jgi:hypothetical protein